MHCDNKKQKDTIFKNWALFFKGGSIQLHNSDLHADIRLK